MSKVKDALSNTKKLIADIHAGLYYKKYFEWGLPARRFIQVNIETNSICTRTCHYCIFGVRKVPAKVMASALFFKIIDQLADMDFNGRVSLFELNEPLTDKRIYDFTKYVKAVLPRCCQVMATNGDLLTTDRIDALLGNGLDYLFVNSYDGEAVKRNEHYVRYGAGKYPGRVQHLDRTGFSDWTSRAGHIEQYMNSAVNAFCEYPNYILYIKPDGKVLACWNDFDEDNIMGDLNFSSIKEVWYGDKFKGFRRFINRGDRRISVLCNRCDHKSDICYMRWNMALVREKHREKAAMDEAVKAKNDAMLLKKHYLADSNL